MKKLKLWPINLKSIGRPFGILLIMIGGLLSNINAAALMEEIPQANDITVTGQVISADDNLPVIGANVIVKGTTTGTATDLDGNYTITVPSDGTLVFSYIGLATTEISVDNQTVLNVTLEADRNALDEVVIVGYSVAKKETLTGSIEQVKADVFEDIATGSPALALQGRTPGLVVTRNSSRPGDEDINFLIRGATSVNGIQPLIVIDGVPAINASTFNDMNPNDIESISVLKGGSAAVYGSRAAGGVILVTTKKGKGDLKIELSTIGRVGTIGIRPPSPTFSEYGQVFLAAADEDLAAGKPPRYFFWDNRENLQRIANGEEGIYTLSILGDVFLGEGGNRFDEMFGNSYSQQHNLSLSGGSETSNFRISAGYDQNVGGLRTVDDIADRYNFSANYNVNLSDKFSINTAISYFHNEVNGPRTGVDREAITFDAPLFPSQNPEGQWYANFGGNIAGARNSVATVSDGGRALDRTEQLRLSALATYKLTDEISVSASYARSQQQGFEQAYAANVLTYNWFGDVAPASINANTFIQEETGTITYQNYKGSINYTKEFGDHSLNGTLAIEAEKNESKDLFVRRNGFVDFGVYDVNLGATDQLVTTSGGGNAWGFYGFIGRLNYAYKGRYLLELQGRRDGSSRFAEGSKWSNYGSVSAGWILSEEDFLVNNDAISFLKIRGGYGELGSTSGIGNFGFLSTVGFGTAVFGETNATQQATSIASGLFSSTTTWERIVTTELGLDFRLFNDKVFGSVDLYQKDNVGMLVRGITPDVLGTATPFTNIGTLETNGWEVVLGYRNKVGDLDFTVSANMSDSRNEITKYEGAQTIFENLNAADRGRNLLNRPINSFFLWETDGYFSTQAEVDEYYESLTPGGILPSQTSNDALRPGDMRVIDSNGDGVLNNDDLTFHGDAATHYVYGLNFEVKYKNFDVSTFFQGVLNHNIYRTGYFAQPFQAEWQNQSNTWLGRTWTEDNQDAEFPRLSTQRGISRWNYRSKDHILQNNRYLRMKSLIVGYNFKGIKVGDTPIENIRVYFSGNDLFEFSSVKDGYDPEFQASSNASAYPFMRTWAMGLRVTL